MSGPYPEDPIKNKPATPLHESSSAAVDYIYIPLDPADTDEYIGAFDSVEMLDGAGTRHIIEARYDVGNNHKVYVEHRRVYTDGGLLKSRYYLGVTNNIGDAAYVKIDGVGVAIDGPDLLFRLRGHRIGDTPDNHVRKMGQVGATYRVANVWVPIASAGVSFTFPPIPATPTFIDVPKDSPFYSSIEQAVALGIVSGYTDPNGRRYFAPGQAVNRAQCVTMIMRSLHAIFD
jgi:hypothetical protein